MSFEVTQTPARNLSAQNVSRWAAAFNNHVFLYQRKDFVITSVVPVGTNRISIDLVGFEMSDQQAIDIVGTNVAVVTGGYNLIGQVLAASVVHSGQLINGLTTLIIESIGNNLPDNTGGFLNSDFLFPFYRFQTTITVAGKLIKAKHTPNPFGLCRVDLAVYLKAFTVTDDDYDYNTLTYLDVNKFKPYQVSISEHYQGFDSQENVLPDTFYVTHSALQYNPYGSNMAEYLTFANEQNDDKKAKFLTAWKEPIKSVGKLFDVAFIVGEQLAGKQLYIRYQTLDINRRPTGSGINAPLLLISPGASLLTSPGQNFLIGPGGDPVISIDSNIGINRFRVMDGFLDTVWYLNIWLFYINNGNPSTFNVSVQEQGGNDYVDVNAQIKVNGAIPIGGSLYTSGSNTFSLPAGSLVSIEASTLQTPVPADPKMTMTVIKNGNIVFRQTIAGNPGASLVYNFTSDQNAVYSADIAGSNGGTNVAPINIPDTTVALGAANIRLTEIKTIALNRCAGDIYLKWLNLLGGWDYCLFSDRTIYNLDVSDAVYYNKPILDYALQDYNQDVLSKSAQESLTIGKDCRTIDELRALNGILYSTKVYRQLDDGAWQTVIVDEKKGASYDTRDKKGDFEITIKIPELNLMAG